MYVCVFMHNLVEEKISHTHTTIQYCMTANLNSPFGAALSKGVHSSRRAMSGYDGQLVRHLSRYLLVSIIQDDATYIISYCMHPFT